jgi:hypothetical protein
VADRSREHAHWLTSDLWATDLTLDQSIRFLVSAAPLAALLIRHSVGLL